MANFLGLDWGEKNIGVALAHAETRLTLPLAVLPNDAALRDKLSAVVEENEIGTIIVGVPRYQEPGTMVRAQEFIQALQKSFPRLEVVAVDEMFTSKMAAHNLRSAGKKDVADHAEAARIMLADYLARSR